MDGKIRESKLFPVIKNNTRKIEFEVRLYDAGEHQLAIGSTAYQAVRIEGEKPAIVFEDFKLSGDRLIQGERVKATATARNLMATAQTMSASLFVDNRKVQNQTIELKPNRTQIVSFELEPAAGKHQLRI